MMMNEVVPNSCPGKKLSRKKSIPVKNWPWKNVSRFFCPGKNVPKNIVLGKGVQRNMSRMSPFKQPDLSMSKLKIMVVPSDSLTVYPPDGPKVLLQELIQVNKNCFFYEF